MATCAFCQKQGRLDKEHLWGRWLNAVLGIKRVRVELGRADGVSSWDASELNLTVRVACRTCNSQWMSRLENTMKRLLGAAIGDASPAVFDLEAQTAIAAWAVKTAMVADYLSADAERYCTARERAYLMRRSEPPPDVYVWIARYDGPWRCRSTLHHLRFPRRRDGRLVPAFSATFAIGRVALQVFSYRSRAADSDTFNVRRGPWDSGLIPLWPRTPGVAVIWPPRHSLSQETFVLLGNRFVMAPKPAGL